MSPAAATQISYDDLYARWERGNWRATEIDFSQDVGDWRDKFDDFERDAALWNYALFFWGEDAVADDLSPLIEAAPREEQKYFLATQQVDEARHAVFFKRFMHEVVGLGDGSIGGGLEAIRPRLTWGFVRTFEELDRAVGALRRDKSATTLAQAVTTYHLLVEATLAQPGQHFIERYLTARDILPGFREGMGKIAFDEQRHIGFGMKLLADLAQDDPEVPAAVAEQLRRVMPYTLAVFVPPNWDTRYAEVFGFTVEEIFEEGVRSLDSKLRAAGLPADTLPGPEIYPTDLPPAERARRGLALLRAGYLGEKLAPPARDHDSLALLMDTVRRGVDHARAPGRPLVLQWEFADAEPWHVHVDNGSTRAEPGREPEPDVTLRCTVEEWADVMAGRHDPLRSMLTGRLRPHGSPRALLAMRRIFAR